MPISSDTTTLRVVAANPTASDTRAPYSRRLRTDPTRIRLELEARGLRDTVVCIDEFQKCPTLTALIGLIYAGARTCDYSWYAIERRDRARFVPWPSPAMRGVPGCASSESA